MRTHAVFAVGCILLCGCADALANAPACTASTDLSLTTGTAINGTATEITACKDGRGNVGVPYRIVLGTASAFRLRATASSGAELIVYEGTAQNLAGARYLGEEVSELQLFLPAGQYLVLVQVKDGGAFSLATLPASNDGCGAPIYTKAGAVIHGQISGGDCTGAGLARQDIYEIHLRGGERVNVNATLQRQGEVLFRTGSANSADLLTRGTGTGGGTVSFSYTAPREGFYRVHMIGTPGGTTIGYSVSIN